MRKVGIVVLIIIKSKNYFFIFIFRSEGRFSSEYYTIDCVENALLQEERLDD